MKTHDGPHDGSHDDFGCRIKHFQVAASAMPTRMNKVPPPVADNAWERGRAGEVRPDGSFMPYLSADSHAPMGLYEYSHRRHEVDEQVRRLKTDPNVLASERQSTS